MKMPTSKLLLIVASIMTLFALVMISWSVVSKTPLAIVVSMSMGQGLGTFALLLYGWAVLRDLRESRVLGAEKRAD